MALACAGYRTKGQGAHQTSFEALKLALGKSTAKTANYFDRCRRKRNELSYDAAGIVSDVEVDEILAKATALQGTVEAWIAKNHPRLT
jgi:hypothetical protein